MIMCHFHDVLHCCNMNIHTVLKVKDQHITTSYKKKVIIKTFLIFL